MEQEKTLDEWIDEGRRGGGNKSINHPGGVPAGVSVSLDESIRLRGRTQFDKFDKKKTRGKRFWERNDYGDEEAAYFPQLDPSSSSLITMDLPQLPDKKVRVMQRVHQEESAGPSSAAARTPSPAGPAAAAAAAAAATVAAAVAAAMAAVVPSVPAAAAAAATAAPSVVAGPSGPGPSVGPGPSSSRPAAAPAAAEALEIPQHRDNMIVCGGFTVRYLSHGNSGVGNNTLWIRVYGSTTVKAKKMRAWLVSRARTINWRTCSVTATEVLDGGQLNKTFRVHFGDSEDLFKCVRFFVDLNKSWGAIATEISRLS